MRPCGCASDVRVFGHTGCTLRPPWAVSPQAGYEHDDADAVQRSAWSRLAMDEVYEMKQRGPQIRQNAPGHAGIPGSGAQAASGDRGAAGMALRGSLRSAAGGA